MKINVKINEQTLETWITTTTLVTSICLLIDFHTEIETTE